MVLCYTIYFISTAVIPFMFQKDVSTEYKETHKVERFYSDTEGADRALVIDKPRDASLVHINLIRAATKTIDISYYSMEKSKATNFFWSLLVDAADRGVHVRILLDGIANGVRYKQRDIVFAFIAHPNIEIRFYEPPNVLIPWALNNRLHDKYVIVDEKLALIGGRNIGDRFWAPAQHEGEITYDRDVLLYRSKKEGQSVVTEIQQYFNEIYSSEYSKEETKKLSQRKNEKGNEQLQLLRKQLKEIKKQYATYFNQEVNWGAFTLPTNKITLIHNPIKRFVKEPWVGYELYGVLQQAEKRIFLQSPYIVPTRQFMNQHIKTIKSMSVPITALTNSKGSTPNFPAFSSYLRFRDDFIHAGVTIFEYQGDNSIHAKSYAIDDNMTMIGSFNFDARSAFLSTETMVVIHSKEVKKQFDEVVKRYMNQSLIAQTDDTYAPSTTIKPREVSTLKNIGLKVVGFFGQFFLFLL